MSSDAWGITMGRAAGGVVAALLIAAGPFGTGQMLAADTAPRVSRRQQTAPQQAPRRQALPQQTPPEHTSPQQTPAHQTPPATKAPQAVPRDTRAPRSGTGVIRGRVVAAETGDPIRRARVVLSASELGKPRFTNSDEQGRYEFTDLPAARFTLTAGKTAYVTLQFGQRRSFEAGRPIQLDDAQVLDRVEIALPRGGVITGRIVDDTGEPMAGASVSVMQPRAADGGRRLVRIGRAVESDDRGMYRLFGLGPGSYVVRASSTFLGETLPFGSAYYPGTPNPAEAERVRVKVGQVRAGVDFTLQPVWLATLSGTAVDGRRGTPLRDGSVRAYDPVGGSSVSGATRPDGSFALTQVPPGDYVLVASGRDAEASSELFGILPVTVTGTDVTGLRIVATQGGRASGRIIFEGTSAPPVGQAAINLFSDPIRAGGLSTGRVGTIRGDWTFELANQHGTRRLSLDRLPHGWALKAVRLDGHDITDTPLDFTGDAEIGGIEIIVSNRLTTLSGHVSDERGSVVADYAVVAFAEDAARWSLPSRYIATARPDLDAKFTITGLPPGSYLVVALEYLDEDEAADPQLLESLRKWATRVTLIEEEATTVELKVRRDDR